MLDSTIDGHVTNIFESFKYKKLRKCGYKSEVLGEDATDNYMVVNVIHLEEMLSYIKSDFEILYWVFDRMWEEWLIVVKQGETIPEIRSLTKKDKEIINKVIENLKTPLGAKTSYISQYDATLLLPVPRITSRKEMGYVTNKQVPFVGIDIWNCYEVSYLTESGKPEACIIRFGYDSKSQNIVESKSVKLYLNSFNQQILTEDIRAIIKRDLKAATKCNEIFVDIVTKHSSNNYVWQSIDEHDVAITTYSYDPSELIVEASDYKFPIRLRSDLLKSNCRMSGLPDWATAYITYVPDKWSITEESLLKYLVSFRDHKEFHEPCCEKIMTDLLSALQPKSLRVELRYTRRGGCDINPIRSYFKSKRAVKFNYLKEFENFEREYRQ